MKVGYTEEENKNFAAGIRKYGIDFEQIQKHFVPTKRVLTLKYRANTEGMNLKKLKGKSPNVVQAALIEFRTFRAEKFKKWKSEWLESLREIKKKKGSNVKNERGITVRSIISRLDYATRC